MGSRLPKYVFLIFSIIYSFRISSALTENPRVQTDVGEIVGTSHSVTVDNRNYTVNKFRGIPYGQPPVAERRFLKALPVERLTSPFNADKFGAACPQLDVPGLPKPSSLSEDCLFLNVYVPDRDPDATSGFAVMVFIHGGGFSYGSSESYGGGTLAAYGNVIVITINYRLGIMGFLSTGDGLAPGNMGLWDQQLALQWVHNNIRAFGGDRDRVTLFAQSAGSACAVLQGLYPGNKRLLHRVIAESGTPAVKTMINFNPLQSTVGVAEFFNCSIRTHKVMMECLRKIDSDYMLREINAAVAADPTKVFLFYPTPVIDKDFIQSDPSAFDGTPGKGKEELNFFRSLDLIIGVSSHEGVTGLAWVGADRDPEAFEPSREMMNSYIPIALAVVGEPANDLASELITAEYTDWKNPDDPKTIREEFVRLAGDVLYTVGSVEYARLHCNKSEKNNTFFYVFSENVTDLYLPKPSWINGANHGDELGFVFGFDETIIRDLEKVPTFVWQGPKDWEWEAALKIMRFWSTFAKRGTPNQPDDDNYEWPSYDMENQQALNISRTMSTIDYVYAREFNFWRHILPKVNKYGAGHAQTSDQDACYANMMLMVTMIGSTWFVRKLTQ